MKIKSDYFWQGKLVRLRPMKIEDGGLWLKEDTDSKAIRCLSYGIELPKSEESVKEFTEKYVNFKNADKRIMFSIETLSGKLVGGINIHSMNKKNGTFSTGIRIYRKYRGKGYAEEAKRIVLRYSFYELRFQKYNVSCLETNDAEIKHLKKIGCREEGRRKRNIYTDGKYYDELYFGMTKEEFKENDKKNK
jgi:RimJ/RimL family protein N-acetyltransferase